VGYVAFTGAYNHNLWSIRLPTVLVDDLDPLQASCDKLNEISFSFLKEMAP
jgi:hypothetical protein